MIDDSELMTCLKQLGGKECLPNETKVKIMSTISLAKFLLEVTDLFVLKRADTELQMFGELCSKNLDKQPTTHPST